MSDTGFTAPSVRSRPVAPAVAGFAALAPAESLAARLLLGDPGLLRLHTASRSALACLLTGTIAVAWTVRTHHPMTLPAFALLFAMVAPLFLRDARRADWFASLAIIYAASCSSFVVASALARWPLAGDAGFLAVLFAGVLCQACGPRALGSAMCGVVMFYLGLYLHPTPAHLTAMVGLSFVAVAAVVFAGRVLVPVRPEAALRRALRSVALRGAQVLHADRTVEHLSIKRLARLNEAAIAVEEQLALLGAPNQNRLRALLADTEVAAAQYVFETPPARRTTVALRRALHRLARAVPPSADPARNAVPHARALSTRAKFRDAWRKLAALRASLAWLPAFRATAAAFIAMLIGQSLSPERWFWAVITTFVVFLGTRSRGDTMQKVGERVLGTLLGVVASAALVTALHGMPLALVAAMLVCVFGWAYFILTAYAPGVFFITVLVGLVYGELGFAIVPLVELRVQEVLAGCVVSIAVAAWLMPLRTAHHVDARIGGVLAAIRDVLAASAPAGAANASGAAAPLVAMRALDRRWQELRVALRPLRTQRVFAWNARVELAAGPLYACVLLARELARAAADGREPTNAAAARLERALAFATDRMARPVRSARQGGVVGDALARTLSAH